MVELVDIQILRTEKVEWNLRCSPSDLDPRSVVFDV